MAVHKLDVRGAKCPMPIVKAKKELEGLAAGDVLEVLATDPGSVKDFQGWAQINTKAHLREQRTEKDETGREPAARSTCTFWKSEADPTNLRSVPAHGHHPQRGRKQPGFRIVSILPSALPVAELPGWQVFDVRPGHPLWLAGNLLSPICTHEKPRAASRRGASAPCIPRGAWPLLLLLWETTWPRRYPDGSRRM
jgi:TusA-related sulfurtransferase